VRAYDFLYHCWWHGVCRDNPYVSDVNLRGFEVVDQCATVNQSLKLLEVLGRKNRGTRVRPELMGTLYAHKRSRQRDILFFWYLFYLILIE
jgi:hypothetical protein